MACGLDSVDGAFSTGYGGASLASFQVRACQVARGAGPVPLGAPPRA